ncbi:MAG: hypothetical protein QM500_06245 [Methylococcales bacterium]
MSKIEEALNKARESRAQGKTEIRTLEDSQQDRFSLRNELVSKDVDGTVIQRVSPTKEIALMDSGDVFDNNRLSELKIIYTEMADSKTANTYRDLRTKLVQKSKGKNFIVMVTSCVQGDSGLTALNIAAAFSFDESKTSLLIDCNLRDPKLDRLLLMEADKGLTDYLENDNIKIDNIMHTTGIKRLKVIPAGTFRETATEFFTSLRMRGLMSSLLARYTDRYIFLNSAPICDSADTRILVELCDFVILVVPYGTSTKNRIKESAEAIGPDKLLGVVFNDKPTLPKFNLFNMFKT